MVLYKRRFPVSRQLLFSTWILFFSDTIQEFMLATNLSEAESTETKLRMAFKIYDKDSSGDLTNHYNACIY